MVNIEETFLTQRQFEVLKLRVRGETLAKIAERFGTSRSNISQIERKARRNIERAKNTLKLIQTIQWPIKVNVKAGANIYQVAEEVFRQADRKGIKVACDYAELVRMITKKLGREGIKRRKILRNLIVLIDSEGKVEVI